MKAPAILDSMIDITARLNVLRLPSFMVYHTVFVIYNVVISSTTKRYIFLIICLNC